jgi:hypothetical protein
MKKITLYGATVRNDGAYVDAGATLTLGDKADEIEAERAKALVDGGTAVSETVAKSDEKGNDPK